jgi:hypothetical protein
MFKLISVLLLSLTTFLFVPSDSSENYFEIAEEKLKVYNPKNKDYVVIIDYTKSLLSERLYLLDMKNKKVILNCRVTHARASGLLYATKFSNVSGSEKSCTGAFISKYSRPGRYGYSMVISGLDEGKNHNVESRVIIFHPTTVPWSKGCFATTKENNKIIIDHIKDGRLIYVIN